MGEYLAQKEKDMKAALIDTMMNPENFKRVMHVYYSLASKIEELSDYIDDLQIRLDEAKEEVEEIEEP